MTFFAPTSKCLLAPTSVLNTPVDSITKSTPQSFQGRFIGFLSEKHLIVLLLITKVSSVY